MYEFIDRPVLSLDHGGRFLVWSMRAWVKSMHNNCCPCAAIGPAFAKSKMISGLPSFHRMMSIFNRDALETFRFCPLDCNRVSEHEALILSFVHSLRSSRPDVVRAALAFVVDSDTVENLVTEILSLGHSMIEADMCVTGPIAPPSEN